jgi:hypothetical protein
MTRTSASRRSRGSVARGTKVAPEMTQLELAKLGGG